MKHEVTVKDSIGFGSLFAAILSYSKWHSFWWMFGHAILSWAYVIYFGIRGY